MVNPRRSPTVLAADEMISTFSRNAAVSVDADGLRPGQSLAKHRRGVNGNIVCKISAYGFDISMLPRSASGYNWMSRIGFEAKCGAKQPYDILACTRTPSSQV